MIPLRDENPSGSAPVVTTLLILANVLVFFRQVGLAANPAALHAFLDRYTLIPATAVALCRDADCPILDLARPFFTSLFLHATWLHLIGNMWFLWIFGDNVEDRLGHVRFLFFYLTCGFLAGLVHVASAPHSAIHTLGASGAIAGVLGAYFLCFPRARVLTLVPLGCLLSLIELPAFILLFFWFAIQLASGAMTLSAGRLDQGGVAWWAHVGGFVAGLILIFILPKRARARQRRYRVWHD